MESLTKEEYNNIPVYFCTDCLALIESYTVMDGKSVAYCPYCGNMEYIKTNINNWSRLVEKQYGENFLKSKKTWKQLMESK